MGYAHRLIERKCLPMGQPLRRASLRHFALLIFIFSLCICVPAIAQPPDVSLARVIDRALADRALAHGIHGVLIESLKEERVLYEKDSDLVFIPASNMKLIVSAAALDLLGPDYRMATSLYVSGEQTPGGLLRGDVILVGKGDPVFKHEHLQAMAAKIKEMGIKVVEGNVVGDDTWFDDVRLGWGWSWDYESYYYAAQISALNVNENVVDVWVRPGRKVDDPASVRVTPPTGYMTVRNECKTSAAGSTKSVFVERVRGRNIIRVTGSVAVDYKPESAEEAITVEEPTLFTCKTLIEMLEREGIKVEGQPVRGTMPAGAKLIMVHESPPMSEMLALLNKPSDNLIAECLLKTLGAQLKGKGTEAAGEEVELEFLKKIGADVSAISINDGSGLSRLNLVSPANLVRILKYMYAHKHSKIYVDSLPIAGVDGTLKGRLKGTAAEGNVRAKTGYIGRVRALSGFVTTKSGEPLVFSILMNNHLCSSKEANAVQDKIVTALAKLGG